MQVVVKACKSLSVNRIACSCNYYYNSVFRRIKIALILHHLKLILLLIKFSYNNRPRFYTSSQLKLTYSPKFKLVVLNNKLQHLNSPNKLLKCLLNRSNLMLKTSSFNNCSSNYKDLLKWEVNTARVIKPATKSAKMAVQLAWACQARVNSNLNPLFTTLTANINSITPTTLLLYKLQNLVSNLITL